MMRKLMILFLISLFLLPSLAGGENPLLKKDNYSSVQVISVGPATTTVTEHLVSPVVVNNQLYVGKRGAVGNTFFSVDPTWGWFRGYSTSTKPSFIVNSGNGNYSNSTSILYLITTDASNNVRDFREDTEAWVTNKTIDIADASDGGSPRGVFVVGAPTAVEITAPYTDYFFVIGANAANTAVNLYKVPITLNRFLDTASATSLTLLTADVSKSHVSVTTDNRKVYTNVAYWDAATTTWLSHTSIIEPNGLTEEYFTDNDYAGGGVIWEIVYCDNPQGIVYSAAQRIGEYFTFSAGTYTYLNGVACDSLGNIYVTNNSLNTVTKYDTAGNILTSWGTTGSGDGEFNGAWGIGIDSADNVYIADAANCRIQKFDSLGTFLTKWGSSGTGDGQFHQPFGICFDASNNVYVTEYFIGAPDNNRVQVFDSSGNFLRKWGSYGTGDGQFKGAQSIAISSNQKVYVADYINNRVQIFDLNGNYLGQFTGLDSPYGITFDSSNYIYIISYYTGIKKYTEIGNLLGSVATSSGKAITISPLTGKLITPKVEIYDKTSFKIGFMTSLFNFTAEYKHSDSLGYYLPLPAGNLYNLAVNNDDRVWGITNAGQVKEFKLTGNSSIGFTRTWGIPSISSDTLSVSRLSRYGPPAIYDGRLWVPYQYNKLLKIYVGGSD